MHNMHKTYTLLGVSIVLTMHSTTTIHTMCSCNGQVVKSQPADHRTKGTESAVLTTDHVVSSDQFKNSSTEKYMRAYESQT